jgi:DNA-binding XRE family transcriptional regulator
MTTEHDNPLPLEGSHERSTPWREVAGLAPLADSMTFGAYMKAYRLGEGWSQSEAGHRLGISKQLVSQYELGKIEPSLKRGYALLAC